MSKFTESITAIVPHMPKFKNPALKQATIDLLAVSDDLKAASIEAEKKVDSAQRRIAIILAGLPVDKSGRKLDVAESEGVKSIPEFMDKIFPGFSPATAYSLAKWGREVLTNGAAREELKAMPYSNYAEVASMEPKVLEAALDSGDIKSSMTQAQLRDARRVLTDKPKVVKLYTLRDARPDVGDVLEGEFPQDELGAALEAALIDARAYKLYSYELEPADAPKMKVKCIRYCVEFPDASALLYDAVPKYTPAKTPAQIEQDALDAALIVRIMKVKGMTEDEARAYCEENGLI